LHSRVNSIYEHIDLADKIKFKKVNAAFTRASAYLHKNKGFKQNDLTHKEVRPLIDETFKVLKNAIKTGITTEIPSVMLNKLEQDVFLFSGMKTYTQLKEASLLLRDETGNIKSEAKFINDIKKIDANYNENYLRAERQYAIAASQSAAQYHEYMQDADRYDLQIRTAADDKVRGSHAVMHNLTLPANDKFWNNTWTPFDWGCRCRIIQVLKGKYTVTDNAEANDAVKKAVPPLFRFNPGREQIIFPEKHPYYPQSCNGAKLDVSRLIGFAQWLLDAEGDRCKAKQVVQNMQQASKAALIKKRKEEFEVYNTDDNYKNVLFDKENGGLKATHIKHNVNKNTAMYESPVQDILYKSGNKIIFEDESDGSKKKGDGLLNDMTVDISTILGSGKNTVVRALLHAKSKKSEVALIYFPDESLYSIDRMNNALVRFKGQTEYRFKKIVVIAGKTILRG
jgi:hypothetical protein